MSVEALYLLRKTEPRPGPQDLDSVVLTADVLTDDGDAVPAGTEGTIVGVYGDGAAFVVEFIEPLGALANVAADGLRLVERT